MVIADPATALVGTGSSSAFGDCATDTFAVSAGGSGRSSPIICGTNTGQHGEHLLDTVQDFFCTDQFLMTKLEIAKNIHLQNDSN